MQTDNLRANKSSGSRTATTNRIENAAKQLRLARQDADEWEDAALRALEADCYQLLTGGFVRASRLSGNSEGTRQEIHGEAAG